jgi:hypothetical protein
MRAATAFLTGRDCAARGVTTDIETAPAVRAEAQIMVAAEANARPRRSNKAFGLAKGTPLSERMALGSPRSADSRSKAF